MRSGWFFGTSMWAEYLHEYAKTRPECLHEWRSSPLANDHNFEEGSLYPGLRFEEHQSQVIDLRTQKWSDVRKSYCGLINHAQRRYIFYNLFNIDYFQAVHRTAFGTVRNDATYRIQDDWLKSCHAICLLAVNEETSASAAAALWIVYQGCAYFASAPSVEKNVMHAVIWKSLEVLKEQGVTLVEMGQIDGVTEKEKNIGKFKTGFGGEAKPFTILRRRL